MEQSFNIVCPSCFASIKIKDRALIGRTAKCPKCDEAVQIEDPDEQEVYGISREEPEWDDTPAGVEEPEKAAEQKQRKPRPTSGGLPPGVRETPIGSFDSGGSKKRRRKTGDKLIGVRIGIHLIFAQLIGLMLMVALLLGEQFGMKIGLSAQALSLGIVALYFLGFTGKAFCLSTPADSGGREFIIMAIVMEVVSFGLGFASALIKIPLLMAIGNFTGFAAGILFLWFLEELSGYVKRDDLVELARSCVGLSVTAFMITLGLWFALLLFPIALFGILMFIPLVMMIVVLVRYITLIFGLRSEL